MMRVLVGICVVLLILIAVCEAGRCPEPGLRDPRRLEPPRGGRRA